MNGTRQRLDPTRRTECAGPEARSYIRDCARGVAFHRSPAGARRAGRRRRAERSTTFTHGRQSALRLQARPSVRVRMRSKRPLVARSGGRAAASSDGTQQERQQCHGRGFICDGCGCNIGSTITTSISAVNTISCSSTSAHTATATSTGTITAGGQRRLRPVR